MNLFEIVVFIAILITSHIDHVRTDRVIIAEDDHNVLTNEIQGGQRPLYNLAHMCNSIKTTLTSLVRGANGVEVDVNFRTDDIYLYHGYPCDCFRFCWDNELFSDYLRFVRRMTTPGEPDYNDHFAILYFDVKLTNVRPEKKEFQGKRFADYLARHYYIDLPMKNTLKLVVSISYAADVNFLKGFLRRMRELNLYEHIKDTIGFDTGMDTNYDAIRNMWSQLNVTNIWQGSGITNCFNPLVRNQVQRLVHERSLSNSYTRKVYSWTIDLTQSIKEALHLGIDGIMTNHPERVASIVADPEFSANIRLATIRDNPFNKYDSSEKTPKQPKHVSTGRRMLTFVNDLHSSLFMFVQEVVRSLSSFRRRAFK